MPLNKTAKFQPSRYNTSGNVTIDGTLTVNGSLILSGTTNISGSGSGSVVSLTGSNVFGSLPENTQVFTGSVYLPFTYASGIIITGSYLTTTYLTSSEVSLGNVIVTGSIQSALVNAVILTGSDVRLGNVIVTSSYTQISGALSVSGSTKFGSLSGDTHQFTGSTYISGNLHVIGQDIIKIGDTQTNSKGSYGIGTSTSHTSSPMVIYSNRANGKNNISISNEAVVSVASIDPNHIIAKFGWKDSSNGYSGSWNITNNSIYSEVSGAASILGTEANGAAAVGTIVGTSASYTTAGSKLFSVQNATTEKEYIGYDGTKVYGISDYGSYMKDAYFSELLSIGNTGITLYSTTSQVPAGSYCYGVAVRVFQTFQTASVFFVGLSSSVAGFVEYWGTDVANTGVTNLTSSLKSGFIHLPNNTSIYISSSVLQGNAPITGSIRIEARYKTLSPITS